jgi:hypothetical protein
MTVHPSVRGIGNIQPREARFLPVARVLNETSAFSVRRLHRSMTSNRAIYRPAFLDFNIRKGRRQYIDLPCKKKEA